MPRNAIEPDYSEFSTSVIVDHFTCRALNPNVTDCFHMPECEVITPLDSFETGARQETFQTGETLGTDNRPLYVQLHDVMRSVDNDDVMKWFKQDVSYNEQFVFALPRVIQANCTASTTSTTSTASTASFSRYSQSIPVT